MKFEDHEPNFFESEAHAVPRGLPIAASASLKRMPSLPRTFFSSAVSSRSFGRADRPGAMGVPGCSRLRVFKGFGHAGCASSASRGGGSCTANGPGHHG